MLSAICFNLDQSKILSSANGLTEIHILPVKIQDHTACLLQTDLGSTLTISVLSEGSFTIRVAFTAS